MTACSMLLAGGSCQMQAPDGGPLFCDVAEPRLFSTAELQARRPHPANLRLDLAHNETGEAHCDWKPAT